MLNPSQNETALSGFKDFLKNLITSELTLAFLIGLIIGLSPNYAFSETSPDDHRMISVCIKKGMDKLGSAASDFMKEMRSGKEFQGLIEGTQNEWVTISSPKEVLRPVVRIQPTKDGETQEIQICGRVAS